MAVEISILVDKTSGRSDFLCEHGMSALVRGPGRTLIFDTGSTPDPLLHNAERLGVDLYEIDGAVISHGHSDHTGGLGSLVNIRADLTIYIHPAAFSRRWSQLKGQPLRDVSCPHSVAALSKAGAKLSFVKAPEKIDDWLVLSGPVGGPANGEGGFIVKRSDQIIADVFTDEMFMLVKGDRGWVVLTGCCHRGLRNTLRMARFLTHDEPISAVVGGLHLQHAKQPQLDEVIDIIKQFGKPDLYPCHCTGNSATMYLQDSMPGKVHPLEAGDKIDF